VMLLTTYYKKPKQLDEQIEILKLQKNVVFKRISEEEAKEHLFLINYINLISPFKHHFAKKSNNNPFKTEKVNGKHVYEHEVDFADYLDMYYDEKSRYPKIYESIRKFESVFNSVLSYRILLHYQIENSVQFKFFVDDLKTRITKVKQKKRTHYLKVINSFEKKIDDYDSPFIFFDRLSLGQQLMVYTCLSTVIKKQILKDLFERQISFSVSDIQTFERKLFTLVNIRNCVYHNNSIKILLRYYDIKSRALRTSSDRKFFTNLIKQLIE